MKNLIPILLLTLFISCVSKKTQNKYFGVKDINGTRIFINSFGKGNPLIIVHGGPGLSHDYFLPHFEKLSENHLLIFYDQRGTGKSSIKQNLDSMNLKTFANDIEGIRKLFGFEKVNILSHSWGALVSLEYILNYPNKVEKLVLSNPVALSNEYDQLVKNKQLSQIDGEYNNKKEALINSIEFKEKRLSAYEELFKLNFSLSFKDKNKVDDIQLKLNNNFFVTNNLVQNYKGLENFNYLERLDEIEIAVLLISGKYDLAILEADKRASDSLIVSQLIIMNNSGHFPFIEEPKEYFQEINDFILN